jgi:Fe-S oxidoreductase
MRYVYAPGCALTDYKPRLAEKAHAFLNETLGEMPLYDVCCRVPHTVSEGTTVVNTCPGCNRRFKQEHEGIDTISLWEVLAESESFPFPDYGGMPLAIHDACPTRSEPKVHAAVRTLLRKMNITALEPEFTGETQHCCGDSLYPAKPIPEIYAAMKARADEMPFPEVCVYCVSCVKALATGGKTPRYLVDLLFHEPTDPNANDNYSFYTELRAYRDAEQNK